MTMSAPVIVPYGSWKSPITSDLIVAETITLFEVLFAGPAVCWVESRPQEGGRYVLVRREPDGRVNDVTPAPFNVRTRVHEYGGGAVALSEGVAYCSHFKDQRLYRLEPGAQPTPLTPAQPLRYADGIVDARRRRWIGVREDHRSTQREAINTIVAISLDAPNEQRVLVSGNDFYSSPRLSPDGQRLAWMTWNHPEMPWTRSELWVADLDAEGIPQQPRRLSGSQPESIFQPEWTPSGDLLFVSDRSGWWNLYRVRQGTEEPEALCPMQAEFARPQWVFGLSTYAIASEGRIVCSYGEKGLDKLAILDPNTKTLTPLDLPFTEFGYVQAAGNRLLFRAGSPKRSACVVQLDLDTRAWEVLRQASTLIEREGLAEYLSEPEPVEFPTTGNRTAHALYYPPHHPGYQAPEGELAPLVVRCHGGPTGAASSSLHLGIQFYTSRGIGVVDVNYGGSTGYGRAYRERLDGQWGIVDVDDCVHAARHLVQQQRADGERVVITGGSAGGYTTLAALTFRDFFKGGASHFGVSDAGALARDTHKFESRYLDSLIGPYPQREDLYQERSPVFHAEQVNAPVIFFQGDEDEIVPPDQTERMVEALRARGVPVGYLLFSGEQHGFRKGENIKRALDAELYFFAMLIFRTGLSF
jgi:dipeptidyl aminopeptidase/acylaminoacyl peptidase